VKAKRRRCGTQMPTVAAGQDRGRQRLQGVQRGYLYSETKEHRYVGITAGDHEAAGRMLRRMSDQVEMPAAEERVGLIDGAAVDPKSIRSTWLGEGFGPGLLSLAGERAKGASRRVRGRVGRGPDVAPRLDAYFKTRGLPFRLFVL